MKDKYIHSVGSILPRLRVPAAKTSPKEARELSDKEWKSSRSRLNAKTGGRSRAGRPRTGRDEQSDQFISLFENIRRLQKLQDAMAAVLRAELRDDCQLAKYENGEMVVFCANANVASYLRYHGQEYIGELRRLPEFYSLQSLRVRLQVK